MGFDFEQMLGPELYDSNTFQFDGQTYHFLRNNPNMYCADRSEKSYSEEGGVAHFNDTPDDETIRGLLSKGYLPYTDTKKDWVKVGGCADGYYSDWIVCLTKAEHYGSSDPTEIPIEEGSQYVERTYTRYRYMLTLGESGRIMCEDLGTASASDIDFNDIVFDGYIYDAVPVKSTKVTMYKDGVETVLQDWSDYVRDYTRTDLGYTLTDVYLLAGGGTIPVTVGGYKLKDTDGFNTTDKVLINTVDDRDPNDVMRYGNVYENGNTYKQPSLLRGIKGIENLNDIQIIVQYGQQIYELKAYDGAVPNKICVPIKTKWPYERVEINKAYNFGDYVKTGTTRETWKVEYTGGNRRQELTLTDAEGNKKIYYLIDDKYNEALWLNPTEAQKANLYHGQTTCPEGNNPDAYYQGDGVDITDIPYASLLRETNVILDDTTGLPEESYTSETKTYGGGYNRDDDDPVLVRKRN